MAFTSEIVGARLKNPAYKRYAEGGKIEEKWGTFENTLGSSGGVIDCECDEVLFHEVTQDIVNPTTPRCQLNVPSAGKVTITTIANATGRWRADCKYN